MATVPKMNKTFCLPMSVIELIKELSEAEQIPQKEVLINAIELYKNRANFMRQMISEVIAGQDSPGRVMVDAQTDAIRAMFEQIMEKSCEKVITAINNREHC